MTSERDYFAYILGLATLNFIWLWSLSVIKMIYNVQAKLKVLKYTFLKLKKAKYLTLQ